MGNEGSPLRRLSRVSRAAAASHRPDGTDFSRVPFRADIEGLRGIAVLLVLLYHAGIPSISGGFIGVDVFFVLSGFLITNHLLAELSSTGRVHLRAFYARRARRLLPAALAVLMATSVAGAIFLPSALFASFVDDLVASAFYIPNILLAVQGTDYLAGTAPSPVQHYWSLGVEEQFYLVWPLLLLSIVAAFGVRRRPLALSVGLLVIASFAFSAIVTFVSQPWAYFSPVSRAWELGAGVLVAVLIGAGVKVRPVVAAIIAWGGLAGILTAAVAFSSTTAFPGFAALLPVASAVALLVFAPHAASFGPRRVLETRPLQFLGRISYALYLVHWPLLTIPPLADPLGEPLTLSASVVLGAASVLIAWLLYRFIERPFLRARWARTAPSARVLVIAGVASVVVALLAVSLAARSAQAPSSTDASASPIDVAAEMVEFAAQVPVNLRPSLEASSADLPEIYASGCHLPLGQEEFPECEYSEEGAEIQLVLFGDSHAAQWFPALMAMDVPLRLQSRTKSSCPPFELTVTTDGVSDVGCDRWRESVLSSIERDPPDIVLMSGFAHYDDYGAPEITSARWSAAVERTVSRLAAVTTVIVVTDTPRFLRPPAICLSANLQSADRCARPQQQSLDTEWIRSENAAVSEAGGHVVDLNSRLCDGRRCGAIIGDVLVYRDEHHLTATMAGELAPVLEEALTPYLRPRS